MDEYNNYKTHWFEYLEDIRPDLSLQSKKLYAHQLNNIMWDNNIRDFDIIKFITRLTNKALRDKSLKFIILDGSDQSKNQRLSAIRSVLDANKNAIEYKKYNNLSIQLSLVGDLLRKNISEKVGTNIKTKDEEENMTATWDDLNEYAKNYNVLDYQNYLILNLMLNNYEEKDSIKYYVLLRVIEYASLHLWNNKKQPPANKVNYIWLHKNKIYIQHSKTTGGIRRVGNAVINQPIFKTYPLNENIKNIIISYAKKNKIKNKQPIFSLDTNNFSKIIKKLLTPFGNNVNSTMLRKIYENRSVDNNLDANQTYELNKNVDHSIGIAKTFYSKKD